MDSTAAETGTATHKHGCPGNLPRTNVAEEDEVALVRAILTGDATPTKHKPPSPSKSKPPPTAISSTSRAVMDLDAEFSATATGAIEQKAIANPAAKRKSPIEEESRSNKSRNMAGPQTGTHVRARRRRRRKAVNSYKHEMDDLHIALDSFKRTESGLRLSASQIAAMTGFHPYSNLPKLVMDLVYQGSIGNLLLQRDAKLLNIEIMSEDESLQRIAKKAGAAVKDAFQKSMDVSKGKRKVKSVQEANVLKDDIMSHVKKSTVLSKGEMKQLEEGIRYNVNTGFGKTHEDDALDLYEKQCGWEVRNRNDDMKCWKFERAVKNGVLTVAPLGPASSLYGTEKKNTDGSAPTSHEDGRCGLSKERDCNNKKSESELFNSSGHEVIEILSSQEEEVDDDEGKANERNQTETSKEKEPSRTTDLGKKEKYFFSIVGVCDGIREELYHIPTCDAQRGSHQSNEPSIDDDDGDDWALREVVIECKHRMKQAFIPPPFYDQIQAVVYCYMYNTSEVEIVQVVRNKEENGKNDKASNNETSTDDNDSNIACASDENQEVESNQDNGKECPESMGKRQRRPQSTITCSRISLDDSIMQHRENWQAVMLPRLRSVVEAVYSVRAKDDKRYRMLHAASLASAGGDDKEWWEIVLKECPWLRDCDIAFSR